MKTLYTHLPDIECLCGDTLPQINISVSGLNLSGCRMELIVASEFGDTTQAVIVKNCTAVSDGFSVQLTSEDTQGLKDGVYSVHFRLVDSDGLSYRRAAGRVCFHSVPRGGL